MQPFLIDFQSHSAQQTFVLDLYEFPLATCVAGAGKENEFDILSQFLKYFDPLLEVFFFTKCFSLLSRHFEVDLRRIIFLPACEHIVSFLVKLEFVYP